MRPHIKIITLGVDDLERSLAFYRDGLGLPTKGIVGTEYEDGAVVFFEMNDDLLLALYPRAALAKDAKVTVGPRSPAELSIGHIVGSREEVDALMERAVRAGAHVADPAHDRFWGGYSGYFQDPDGHLWEIAWNPAWHVPEQRSEAVMSPESYAVHAIGFVHSPLERLNDAPMQGSEGAPEAVVEIRADFAEALDGITRGSEVMLLTWLHLADRETLMVHPRDDFDLPLTGVFATRSADRPNPIGLHRVRVLGVEDRRVRVAPLEAIDGTPVVDIKPVLRTD